MTDSKSGGMRRELFVYYRVHAGQEAAARAAVQGFQAGLCRVHPHLSARLLVRPSAPGGSETWMETYAMAGSGHAVGVDAELESAIEAQAQALSVARFIDGTRHVEVFVVASDD